MEEYIEITIIKHLSRHLPLLGIIYQILHCRDYRHEILSSVLFIFTSRRG